MRDIESANQTSRTVGGRTEVKRKTGISERCNDGGGGDEEKTKLNSVA
jgi:hypothetical protein